MGGVGSARSPRGPMPPFSPPAGEPARCASSGCPTSARRSSSSPSRHRNAASTGS